MKIEREATVGFKAISLGDAVGRKYYEPGDRVPGIGIVNSNHCGLPWVAYMDSTHGGLLYGVISVQVLENFEQYRQSTICCDAISGSPLTDEEKEIRKDNEDFDYGHRSRDNIGRRHPGQLPKDITKHWSEWRWVLKRVLNKRA